MLRYRMPLFHHLVLLAGALCGTAAISGAETAVKKPQPAKKNAATSVNQVQALIKLLNEPIETHDLQARNLTFKEFLGHLHNQMPFSSLSHLDLVITLHW